MDEALGALLRPLDRGHRKADWASVQEKNLLTEPKHGVAASESSELPISGCYK